MRYLMVFFAYLTIFLSIASSGPVFDEFIPMEERIKSSDVLFAGLIVNDEAILPNSPDINGAYRKMTVKPIFTFKGDLNLNKITIDHSFTKAIYSEINPTKVVNWYTEHSRHRFVIGAIYFFFLNNENGKFVYKGIINCNIYLDDPQGQNRIKLEEALKKETIELHKDWKNKLDEDILKAYNERQFNFIDNIPLWINDVDGLIVLNRWKIEKVMPYEFKPLKYMISDKLDMDIFEKSSVILSYQDNSEKMLARDWHVMLHRQMTYDSEHLNNLATILKLDGKVNVYPYVVNCDDVKACWINLNSINKDSLTAIPIVWSFNNDTFKEISELVNKDQYSLIIPVRIYKENKKNIIKGCSEPVFIKRDKVELYWRDIESMKNQWRDIRFIDMVVSKPLNQTKEDIDKVNGILGRNFQYGTSEGKGNLSRYWSLIARPEYERRLLRQIMEK